MPAADPAPLSGEEFASLIGALALPPEQSYAVGISGGPDSMALAFLLSRWAEAANIRIHALTIDHGLRGDSAAEAQKVASWLSGWPNLTHKILSWQDEKPHSRILEEARAARYDLLKSYCKTNNIHGLFIAHHQDDQAETFLLRLAAGSGLDGLAGMKPLQVADENLTLIRPFLSLPKDRLIATCTANNVPFVSDPTNLNPAFARPRLRAAKDTLEREGLSAKRLSVTARRMARARDALETLTQAAFDRALIHPHNDNEFSFDLKVLLQNPEELILRIALKSMASLRPGADYAPRLERVEDLCLRLQNDPLFKKATLGGCLFAIDRKTGQISIRKEQTP